MRHREIDDEQRLENRFHRDMQHLYDEAWRKCKYKATYFMQMVSEHGGVQTAKILLNKSGYQYGFTELWLCGCLNLSVEAHVLRSAYAELFTDDETQVARKRLEERGYKCDN